MKKFKCVKDFYIEDTKFSSKEDIVQLLQDNCTVVNLKEGQKVLNTSDILNNPEYFIKINDIDNINHPKHYTQHPSGVECIDITRHYCFSIGNAIKYLWRAGLKQDSDLTSREKEIEDLEKAIWYINDRIKQLKHGEVSSIRLC